MNKDTKQIILELIIVIESMLDKVAVHGDDRYCPVHQEEEQLNAIKEKLGDM